MPAVSKAQYGLMRAVAGGKRKLPGMSAQEAAEYVEHQSPEGLPKKKKKRKATEIKGKEKF